ncbi:MAG TPA: thioredoxin family protein [Chloroflexota bacterium]|nr:thioredoxin family protein [Chloroflexota bacterium]
MSIIGPAERERLRTILDRDLVADVRLLLFVQPPSGLFVPGREEPQTGRQTRLLLEELAGLSPRLHLEVHNPRGEPELARRYGVERSPALLIRPWPEGADGADGAEGEEGEERAEAAAPGDPAGPAPTGGEVRFFGLPSGYEFATILEDIADVSRRRTRLSDATRARLAGLTEPLHVQVFVTPTCPHCPSVARLAHQLAMESPAVTADVIEANEFPALSAEFAVQAVPKTVVSGAGGTVEFLGALPEARFVEEVWRAVPAGGGEGPAGPAGEGGRR